MVCNIFPIKSFDGETNFNKFPIICLCGSVRCKERFLEVAKYMELSGRIVVMPNVYSKTDNIILTEEDLELLTEIHNKKIEMSDEVFIIDDLGPDGKPYIGYSTKQEIEYAKTLGKPIVYLSEGDEQCPK